MPGRLIPREEVPEYLNEQQEREKKAREPVPPSPTAVVRRWVKGKNDSRSSARAEFDRLFAEKEGGEK